MTKAFFESNLQNMPSYTNCLLSGIDPVTDRIMVTYFVPQGSMFEESSLKDIYVEGMDYEMIFFDLHAGNIPVFSLTGMRPFMLKNIEQFSPFWSLLRYETINSNFLKDYLVELTLGKMAIFVLRDFHDLSSEQFAKLRQNFSTERLYKIINYIHENLHSDISLEEMGKMVELSVDYISQYFKRSVGESIQTYAIDQRIKSGLYYLVITKDSIYNISEKTGFIDQAYFNRRFKKFFNVSPMDVRKAYRELFKLVAVSPPPIAVAVQGFAR
jgi:AraC-like DNA-binding protein